MNKKIDIKLNGNIENVKKEMSKNYRDIKSEILKNEGVTAQKFNNLNDNFKVDKNLLILVYNFLNLQN